MSIFRVFSLSFLSPIDVRCCLHLRWFKSQRQHLSHSFTLLLQSLNSLIKLLSLTLSFLYCCCCLFVVGKNIFLLFFWFNGATYLIDSWKICVIWWCPDKGLNLIFYFCYWLFSCSIKKRMIKLTSYIYTLMKTISNIFCCCENLKFENFRLELSLWRHFWNVFIIIPFFLCLKCSLIYIFIHSLSSNTCIKMCFSHNNRKFFIIKMSIWQKHSSFLVTKKILYLNNVGLDEAKTIKILWEFPTHFYFYNREMFVVQCYIASTSFFLSYSLTHHRW
jgi:hypothetical protein